MIWRRIFLLVEGQTEERFVKDSLAPHLAQRNILPIPTIVKTSRLSSGATFKGGVTTYQRIRNDLDKLFHDSDAALVTTMLDYYRLPSDFPGYSDSVGGDYLARVKHLERKLEADITDKRFFAYLQVHEYEALLFAKPEEITTTLEDITSLLGRRRAARLKAIRGQFQSPEEINEAYETCPHRRIEQVYPGFRKALHGPTVAKRIGLDIIRKECAHFNEWLSRLEAL